jgi:dienelactone hydrolase
MSSYARLISRAAAAAVAALLATTALAEDGLQPGPQGPAAGPYRAQEWRIPVPDADGATTRLLEALLYRPADEARRPLVIVSHGSPRRMQDRAGMRPDWAERAAAFLVAEGYAVLAPMRRGYGRSPGDADDRASGPCSNPDYTDAGLRVGRQILAIADYMKRQGFVDANRIVLAGQSAGGFGSLAAASFQPEGVIAVINFAGGRGSRAANDVCGEARLVEAMGRFGATARVPSIWLYSENDLFFRPDLARRMHAAYALGGARSSLHILSAYGSDGHGFVRRADSAAEWQPAVREFLASLGGRVQRAPPSVGRQPPPAREAPRMQRQAPQDRAQ